MKTFLDGHLLHWLEDLQLIQKLKALPLTYDFMFVESHIINLIKNARKGGDNWVWSYNDIYKEKDEKEWQLPVVDICEHFGLNTNNELKAFFKKKKIDLCCDWDTEAGGWYPRFKHLEDAQRCVDTVNDLLDERYLKT